MVGVLTKKKGFTLIELLVVVAIIGILADIEGCLLMMVVPFMITIFTIVVIYISKEVIINFLKKDIQKIFRK
jgi:prepilin-type N-terminal cleavage/methylation domain-containing protein